MSKSTSEWIELFQKEIPKELTLSRWEHSVRVAESAEQLANIHSYPEPKIAYLAGITHDITKQKKNEFHLQLFKEHLEFDFSSIPEESYHAFSAVFYLQNQYSFYNPEIFSAISSHTLGKKEMSLLDKLIYASDFLGSDYAMKQSSYKIWKQKTEENLNFGVYLKASKTIHQLIESKSKIFPTTIDTYNESINKIC